MYLKPIDRIPERGERSVKRANNNIKNMLLDFYNSESDIAEVMFSHREYVSSASLYSSIKKALNILHDIPITAEFIQGGIYLRRTE